MGSCRKIEFFDFVSNLSRIDSKAANNFKDFITDKFTKGEDVYFCSGEEGDGSIYITNDSTSSLPDKWLRLDESGSVYDVYTNEPVLWRTSKVVPASPWWDPSKTSWMNGLVANQNDHTYSNFGHSSLVGGDYLYNFNQNTTEQSSNVQSFFISPRFARIFIASLFGVDELETEVSPEEKTLIKGFQSSLRRKSEDTLSQEQKEKIRESMGFGSKIPGLTGEDSFKMKMELSPDPCFCKTGRRVTFCFCPNRN